MRIKPGGVETVHEFSVYVQLEIGDPVPDGVDLDLVTAHAYESHPDFFVPFARGFNFDDDEAETQIRFCLGDAFRGLGELFVHGHGSNYDDTNRLATLFLVAVPFDAPVLVHWDIGNVDHFLSDGVTPNPNTADGNFEDLKATLDSVAATLGGSSALKLILAHCGVGPGEMNPETLAAFEARLDELLSSYPNVSFDLAGMQANGNLQLYMGSYPSATLTELGTLLLERMIAMPSRFLIGIDTENRSEATTESWAESIGNYRFFLSLSDSVVYGPLSDTDVGLITSGNAITLF